MKVYSLYHNDTFVAAFSSREETVSYGKIHYNNDPWSCNIVEEYLSKSPLVYSPPHYTHLGTAPGKLDLGTGITVYPGPAQINNTRAETENTIYAPGTK